MNTENYHHLIRVEIELRSMLMDAFGLITALSHTPIVKEVIKDDVEKYKKFAYKYDIAIADRFVGDHMLLTALRKLQMMYNDSQFKDVEDEST